MFNSYLLYLIKLQEEEVEVGVEAVVEEEVGVGVIIPNMDEAVSIPTALVVAIICLRRLMLMTKWRVQMVVFIQPKMPQVL